jgi:hypothetical protein
MWAVKLASAAYLARLASHAVRPGGTSVFAPVELSPDTNPQSIQRYVTGTILGLIAVKLATDKARAVAAEGCRRPGLSIAATSATAAG